MAVAAFVYLALIVSVVWAASRGYGSRWLYAAIAGVAPVAGALMIILAPSANRGGNDLAPARASWLEPLLHWGSWLGGGLLLLGLAALVGSFIYRPASVPSPDRVHR
jgi:hypothetical protein